MGCLVIVDVNVAVFIYLQTSVLESDGTVM